jgi:lipopolysaccharide transport system permease protein
VGTEAGGILKRHGLTCKKLVECRISSAKVATVPLGEVHHVTVKSATIAGLIETLVTKRDLVRQLASREFASRFRGSMLGSAWAIVTPLLLATVYTFVFNTVFKMRWTEADSPSNLNFAVYLILGLAVHGIFVECISRAPHLILSNPSYVTKVVFPLEVLPFVLLASALTNAGISITIAILLNWLVSGSLHQSIVFIPLIVIPYAIFISAFVMILAACGVYLRDLAQVVNVIIPVSLFLTPVFYPLTAVPSVVRNLMWINPLTFAVEQIRATTVAGLVPNLLGLLLYTTASLGALSVSFWLFQRLRKGFADVL